MTSYESMCVLAIGCHYIDKAKIEGDFVETGIWRGGSSILAARLLKEDRLLHLFDTYEGMPEPGLEDYRIGESNYDQTKAKWESLRDGIGSAWVRSSLYDVRKNFRDFAVEVSRLNFVVGKVEDTLPRFKIQNIALIRIDTDFYSSTRLALLTLWPKLSYGGLLILDDYAHWDGARKATDEFFSGKNILMLAIPNSGGRVIVKQQDWTLNQDSKPAV